MAKQSSDVLDQIKNDLVDKSGNTYKLEDDPNVEDVGLYFSAHWCPPCRGFTPVLAQSYKEWKDAGKPVEIIFISSDRTEADFKEYFGEMPWKALKYSNRDLKNAVAGAFGVRGIPTLVVLKKNGEVISMNARSAVANRKYLTDS